MLQFRIHDIVDLLLKSGSSEGEILHAIKHHLRDRKRLIEKEYPASPSASTEVQMLEDIARLLEETAAKVYEIRRQASL